MPNNSPDFAKIWNLPDFPPIIPKEVIKFVFRRDLSVFTGIMQFYFTIIIALVGIRLGVINMTTDAKWVYFWDMSIFGLVAIFLVVIAYHFHNYYLTLFVFTDSRLIMYQQLTLVSAQVNTFDHSEILILKAKQDKAREVSAGIGTLEMVYKPDKKIELTHIASPIQLSEELLKFIKLPEPEKITKL
jgi:hypothetical protein